VYAGGTLQSESYTNIVPICWDKIENHRNIGVNVLFNDGHVEWVRLKRWEKIKPAKSIRVDSSLE
jgi:prepilin-type processing-associated H-X9-DG protein